VSSGYDRAPVSVAHPHSKLIIAAARDVLRPLGVCQKGRSRTWLDDRGWWLGVVEFQPSSYSRGTYLNVGVNWLWNVKDYLSFDYGHRVNFDFAGTRGGQYIEYESDEQFEPLARKLAMLAADQLRHYRDLFETIRSTADELRQGERAWLDAGIALGLAGEDAATLEMLRLHISQFESDQQKEWRTQVDVDRFERAQLLSALAPDHSAFCDHIRDDITAARSLLKLEPQAAVPF
jgi:hypothetical protein